MKTKFLFTVLLAAMAFTSCQKDGQDASAKSGQDTYIGMTIQLPKSATVRAFDGDDNATEAESKLGSITVGTWRDGDLAITYTDLSLSDLTNNNNGTYTAIKAIKAKTGKNNIIVIANSDAKLTLAQINSGETFPAEAATIAKDNKFVMYSDAVNVLSDVKAADRTEVEAGSVASNNAVVTLRRASAKVSITSSLVATDATGIPEGLGNGKLTNIVWGIANQNTEMTVLPKLITGTNFIASNVKSPFANMAAYVAPTTGLPKINEVPSVAYCLENSHGTELYLENNTTAVQVSATFAPGNGKYVSEITGTDAVDAVVVRGTSDMVAGTTFYVSNKDIGTIVSGTYFSEQAVLDANTIYSAPVTDFIEYIDGQCFWPIWINDGNANKPSYGVLRNHMYKMNITGIKAPGFPSFPNADSPIAADTWIMVDLEVEKWNSKDMGDIEL